MYDSLTFWLSIEEAGLFDLNSVLNRISNISEITKSDGLTSFHGQVGENCKISLSERGIRINGSLAKYFLNDNFHTLTRSDSERAIEKLSDELLLPIQKAKVTRIDFAQNILTKYKPELYFPYLGDSTHYSRFSQERSLYYKNGLRTKLFYNKVEEGKSKGLKPPKIWIGKNVLRYEFRVLKRLPKEFNRPQVLASTLSDEKFYIELFDRWFDGYKSISKINQANLNLSKMNSPKDFMKQMMLLSIQSLGQDKVLELVEELRAINQFEKPEYYSRLKKEIRELCKNPLYSETSELVEELDKKIKQSKLHYR